MGAAHWRSKALLAVVFAGVIVVTGRGAVWVFSTIAAHPDPAAVPSTAGAYAEQYSDAIEGGRRLARQIVSEENLPGLSVAVGVGGDILWSEGFGWADIKTRVPVTPDTRFWIGTASTVLTSAAVGVLLEQGRLTLDGEIQTSVPEFPKKPWPVTLRQSMGHVAGLSTDSGNDGPLFRQRCERPVAALPHFVDRELLFEPGTQYLHSKYGWILVSAAVETVTGQPFLTVMRERIFQPLGMNHTGAESATEENPDRVGEPAEDAPFLTFIRQVILEPLGMGGTTAKPATAPATVYFPGFGPLFAHGLRVMRPHNLSCYAGSMAFLSTPSDLVRFGLAIDSGRLLQPATVQLLQTSQRLTSGEETGYGLGWKIENVVAAGEPRLAAGHDGEVLGRQVMSFMMFPEAGIVVAVMSNIPYAETSSLTLKIAEAFAPKGSIREEHQARTSD